MGTFARPDSAGLLKERAFFFYMALAMVIVTLTGFIRFIISGLSTFEAPWWVHVHGLTMMGWLALYLVQNSLVFGGNVGIHRRLGPAAVAWSIWVFCTGFMVLAFNAIELRTPPFFPGAFMFAMDGLTLIAFGVLTWTGFAMRSRSDWHKRLMLGGTILLIQPGLGRLVPLNMLGTNIPYLVFPAHLLLFAVAIVHDLRVHGRVHPAYYWGLVALVAVTALPIYVAQATPLVGLVTLLRG